MIFLGKHLNHLLNNTTGVDISESLPFKHKKYPELMKLK